MSKIPSSALVDDSPGLVAGGVPVHVGPVHRRHRLAGSPVGDAGECLGVWPLHRTPAIAGRLKVRIEGDAPGRATAGLWHSLFVDERTWDRVVPDLAQDRRLVIITCPGHGASGDPARRYTLQDCADAASALAGHCRGVRGPLTTLTGLPTATGPDVAHGEDDMGTELGQRPGLHETET